MKAAACACALLLAACAGPRAPAPAPMPPHADARGDGDAAALVPVVPLPRYARVERGAFAWPARVTLAARDPALRDVAEHLRAYLAQNGVTATIAARGDARGVVLELAHARDARLGDEGYALHAQPERIVLRANAARGAFYALQTLEQLTTRSAAGLRTRAATIVDAPAYRWRGIHLDVARHFFAVPVVERYIDLAAHYKLNVFHWHLSDDQAWRLQSSRYPALGAGGERYTRADVRAVIAFAARRYVTVVPELDLPAHAGAALRAYPKLGCGHATLCTSGAGLAFARDVLDEVMAQFPSAYVHGGGDEVPAPASRAQPQFTHALERSVAARGRRLVGWDEIFTPALAPRTVVMVWTSRARAARIARHGNDVVIASGTLYFDSAQGDPQQEPRANGHMATLAQVYADGVLPAGVTGRAAAHVLGAQANLWTERIATPERLFAMVLPRELALAEDVWTPRARKRWPSFLARLPAQFAWLRAHGYAFRLPNASFAVAGGRVAFAAVPGRVQAVTAWTSAPSLTVRLDVPLAGAVIRYTTDGTPPSPTSRAYRGPFTVSVGRRSADLRAVAYLDGRAGTITACTIVRVSPAALRAHADASTSWSALVSP